MVPVIMEMRKFPDVFNFKVCVTAQHREMLDQVLNVFNIIPDFDLNLMEKNQDLFDITLKVLLGVRDILIKYKPDVILVHGDTTTTMAAAMAAFYLHIRIGHIEAGLRTNNLYSPWPEEMNRQVTDRISDFYFVPTSASRQNLLNENVPGEMIFVTGNTVIDTLFMAVKIIESDPGIRENIRKLINSYGYNFADKFEMQRPYILITGHRRENFGQGFINICQAISTLAENHPELDFVYPVHLNPNVQRPVYELLSGHSNVYLIPPVDYLPFVYIMKNCYFILTDSGGVQEEAPSFGKPVLVMRNITERSEAIEAGTVLLVGTDKDSILFHTEELLNNKKLYKKMTKTYNPYGDGYAAERIVKALHRQLI